MNSSPPLISGIPEISGIRWNLGEFGKNSGNFGRTEWNSVEFSMALRMNSVGIPGGFRGNAGFWGKFGVWGGFGRFGGPAQIARKRMENGPKSENGKNSASPRGRSGYLLETPFSEPLLRTLLRTLFYCKTHSRPPSQNPSENTSQNLLRTRLGTLCCRKTP